MTAAKTWRSDLFYVRRVGQPFDRSLVVSDAKSACQTVGRVAKFRKRAQLRFIRHIELHEARFPHFGLMCGFEGWQIQIRLACNRPTLIAARAMMQAHSAPP
jgi:hypothetical protein